MAMLQLPPQERMVLLVAAARTRGDRISTVNVFPLEAIDLSMAH